MAGDSDSDDSRSGDVEREAASAETPLLGTEGRSDDPHDYHPGALFKQNVVILSLVVILLLGLGSGMLTPPANALIEDIICREYHPEVVGHHLANGLSNDPLCKNPDVQGRLANIRGWGATFDCVPGIIATIPYGILSDKWGRVPVLVLSLVGFALSVMSMCVTLWFSNIFPVWTVWLSSIFMLIGGSTSVTQAMVYTLIADVVPVAERATVFFQLITALLLSAMVASPLSGFLMRRSPWLPVAVGFLIVVLGILAALAIPETLGLKKSRDDLRTEGDEADMADPALAGDPEVPTMRKSIAKAWEDMDEVWRFILGNKRIAFLMMAIMFFAVGRYVQEMLLQYATKRYGWTWDEAAILLTVSGAANLAVLVVILPAVSWVCLNYLSMSALTKDLWIARVTGIIQVIGAVMVAFSFKPSLLAVSLVVFAGGGGFTSVVRSLLNAIVEEHHVGTLNTLVAFIDMVFMMIAGPTLAKALGLGIELGGPWIGLPFLFAALLFTFATVIVWVFRLPGPRGLV